KKSPMPPIRMVDDPNDDSNNSGDDTGGGGGGGFSGGGGGGGGLFGIILALLGLFRGRGLIVLLIVLAGGYFLIGRTGCGAGILHQVALGLTTGWFLDPKQFEKANIYESLSDDSTKNPLPEAVNLQKYAPGVGDQGHQGSCVAWSSAYGARTIAEA